MSNKTLNNKKINITLKRIELFNLFIACHDEANMAYHNNDKESFNKWVDLKIKIENALIDFEIKYDTKK